MGRPKSTHCRVCGKSGQRVKLRDGLCRKCLPEYKRKWHENHRTQWAKMPAIGETFHAVMRRPPYLRHQRGPFVCTDRPSRYFVEGRDRKQGGDEPGQWLFERRFWDFQILAQKTGPQDCA